MQSSYLTEYGSSLRSSRIGVPFRPKSSWAAVAKLSATPDFVYVDPSTRRVAIRHGNRVTLGSTAGVLDRTAGRMTSYGWVPFALMPWGTLVDGQAHDMAGEIPPERSGIQTMLDNQAGVIERGGLQFAQAVVGDSHAAIAFRHASRQEPAEEVYVTVERHPSDLSRFSVWHEHVKGMGSGAIAADLRIAVALARRGELVADYRLPTGAKGRFLVFAPGGDPASDPAKNHGIRKSLALVSRDLDESPYDVSVIEPGFALLSGEDERLREGAFHDRKPDIEEARFRRVCRVRVGAEKVGLHWSTVVHRLDREGREVWRAKVPFEVLEPPIDGGAGRVYVAGNGIAALRDGKVLWGWAQAMPAYATAFEDGALAVASGGELRILSPEGAVLQFFRAREGERFSTPPAIGEDGSVWAATDHALYRAH